MELRPLRTDEDHRTTLAEIEALWDTPDGSPEAERLEVLVELVEAYELEHYPIAPPDPCA